MVHRIWGSLDGNIWVGTQKGLSKLDPEQLTFDNYAPEDGLPIRQFADRSIFLTPQGKFLMGGSEGLIQFHPDQLL